MLFLAAIMLPLEGAEPKETFSVCDVLRDPTRFNGKLTAIRGFLVGTGEGVWLNGNCTNHLQTQSVIWPNVIWLAYAGSSAALHDVDFTVDRQALADMEARIRGSNLPNAQIWATYVGLLETRESMSLEVYTGKDGKQHPAGFGHLAGAPAQLLIKTVKDVVIKGPRKSSRNTARVLPSFWYVEDETGSQYIVSGGNNNGYLHIWVTTAAQSLTGPDNPSTGNIWYSTSDAPWNCDAVKRLLAAANTCGQTKFQYHPITGPNSNTVARYLGAAGGFDPSEPGTVTFINWSAWLIP